MAMTSRPVKFTPIHQPRDYKITEESFDYLTVLGQGSFGKVILCREKTSKLLYAIKTQKKKIVSKNVSFALNEHEALKVISHPFLTSLKYSFQTNELLCFVMEYAGGGDLFFHLQKVRRFSEEDSEFYAAEITSAIGYLHSKWIVHRDIKLDNILLDKHGHIKLTDFGLCKRDVPPGKFCKSFCGTPEYMAPEILYGQPYGYAVDWWSFGVAMYRMMYGKLPFKGLTRKFDRFKILSAGAEFPNTLTWKARNFLRVLLIVDPNTRLGGGYQDAAEVMMHPFFQEISWMNLIQKRTSPPFRPRVRTELDTKYFGNFSEESIEPTPSKETVEEGEDYEKLGFVFKDTGFTT